MITLILKRFRRFYGHRLIRVTRSCYPRNVKNFSLFRYLTICAASAVFFTTISPAANTAEPVFVRVAVARDTPSVKVFIAGSYKIVNAITKKSLLEGGYLSGCSLTATDTGFMLGETAFGANAVEIESAGGARIYINDRIFRGEIRVFKTGKGLTAVNTVELEEYLYGVVRNEVSTWWPMEAIKAQVIAARTYALYQIKESRGKDYDVTADVGSQVYGGIFSEKWRTNRAVDLTKGKALVYNGAIFPSYFHATCGGATFDAANLWNISLPTLKGVKCGWCKKSPHFLWERHMPLQEAQTKLHDAGYEAGDIKSFEAVSKDPSGRIMKIRIGGSQGAFDMAGKDFRSIIGTDILRSTNFKAAIIGDNVIFEGFGWGHGVGMCQWGAYYMSRAGKKAEEVLNFYYPGSKIANYYTLNNQ
jgi:stage II sporulation protein D